MAKNEEKKKVDFIGHINLGNPIKNHLNHQTYEELYKVNHKEEKKEEKK